MKHVILGIDPGTTVGYAVLDIKGNVLLCDEKKQLDIDTLVTKVFTIGKPLIIGTDKKKVPSFVHQVASKTGGKVVLPATDLSVAKKQHMTGKPKSHAHDALASAQYAYHQMKSIINKIIQFAQEHQVMERLDVLLELVVKKGVSRTAALHVLQDKPLIAPLLKSQANKQDYAKVLAKLARIQQENIVKTTEIKRLRAAMKQLQKRTVMTPKKVIKQSPPSQAKEVKKLKAKLSTLSRLALQNRIVAPVIPNLGIRAVNKALDMDVVVVEQPAEFSREALTLMQDKVIVTESKYRHSLLSMVSSQEVRMQIFDKLAFIDKNSLKKALAKKDMLDKIVREYKQSRSNH